MKVDPKIISSNANSVGKPVMNQKLKISILINDMRAGGAERVVSILLSKLKEIFEVHLVLLNDLIEYDLPKAQIVKILACEKKSFISNQFLRIPAFAKEYASYCIANDIEKSLSFTYRSNYINSLSKSYNYRGKVLISERSFPSKSYPGYGMKSFISKILIKRLYNRSDLIITNSKLSAIDLKENFGVTKALTTIYNPINQVTYNKRNNRSKKFTFINVANLYSYKNHDLIIKAFSKLTSTNSELIIIGKGECELQLKDLVDSLNLNDRVKLLGYKKNPSNYLKKSDCFILASSHEGFPNSILEAMAHGLPVISSDCQSGPREILSPESDITITLSDKIEQADYGFLTPVHDLGNLVKAMEIIMFNDEIRNNLSSASLKRSGDFNPSFICNKYIEEIYNV